ncbi:MAG: holo-ACP synthase [Thomasclavelia sp.]|jgi:holo-[acyl-carrier protein] synthase|nr:holo-ACP synthase [Thomasclavelia sp.]
MIKGIGVDICNYTRFKDLEHLAAKILTQKELSIFLEKKTLQQQKEFLGGRFAGKEAYIKAFQGNIDFKKIEILNKEDGSPYLNDDKAKISISHEKEYAIAFVIIED